MRGRHFETFTNYFYYLFTCLKGAMQCFFCRRGFRGKKHCPTRVEGQGVLPFGIGKRAAILHNTSYIHPAFSWCAARLNSAQGLYNLCYVNIAWVFVRGERKAIKDRRNAEHGWILWPGDWGWNSLKPKVSPSHK